MSDTTRTRKTASQVQRSSALASTLGTFKSLAFAFIMALVIKHSVIEAYNVPTSSMEDTILVGDFLLANKFIYGFHIPLTGITMQGLHDPRPGDIVVFKFPGDSTTNYVKRCIAVGGQLVEMREKVLYVDGELVPSFEHQKHNDPGIDRRRDSFGPYRVPTGHFFMLGDNRDDSYDSRYWGPVPQRFILGKALVVHWSWGSAPDPDAPKFDWTKPLSWPGGFWYNLIHFHERVRWERLGQVLS